MVEKKYQKISKKYSVSKFKSITIIIIMIIGVLFLSGCEDTNNIENITNDNNPNTQQKDENQVSNTNLTPNKDNILNNSDFNLDDALNQILFNQNLTNFEKEWLGYLEIKYPHSKIIHINTKDINCENCYELQYKKDMEIIKIKVLDNTKVGETITDKITTEIVNNKICTLFQGEWNECPKVCETDELACSTMCGNPICEFDTEKIVYKKIGEKCGNLNFGICEYGLTCYYESNQEDFGICKEK